MFLCCACLVFLFFLSPVIFLTPLLTHKWINQTEWWNVKEVEVTSLIALQILLLWTERLPKVSWCNQLDVLIFCFNLKVICSQFFKIYFGLFAAKHECKEFNRNSPPDNLANTYPTPTMRMSTDAKRNWTHQKGFLFFPKYVFDFRILFWKLSRGQCY